MMDDYSILDAELPTMVVRYNNTLVLRSVITGQHLQVLGPVPNWAEESLPAAVRQKSEQIEQEYIKALEAVISLMSYEEQPTTATTTTTKPTVVRPERNKSPVNSTELPPCKVQRNYCCTLCAYYTQNPRSHLLHLRDVHGVRLSIHSCQHCQYASRYCQKLKRHIKMVHTIGSRQEIVLKVDAPIDKDCKDIKEPSLKQKQLPMSIPETQPLQVKAPQQPPVATPEMPCCSKAIETPPKCIVNVRTDPEAFFVSAYKNQLQKQLEYEQRLKNFLKSCDTPDEQPIEKQRAFGISAKPSEPLSINTSTPYSIVNKPNLSTEGNTDIRNELEKKRMYNCRKCSYITHIKSRYNKHVKYHSMPMIQCDKCEFRTTYKWNLTRHLRSHHGNGIYKCSVCTFSANMKQSLTSHEANHHSPPVGRAVRNKPIRKRRCRVGGSDLQADDNSPQSKPLSSSEDHNAENVSLELSRLPSSIKQEVTINVPAIRDTNFDALGNNSIGENDLQEMQINVHDPSSADLSDTDNSELETSESSDMEINEDYEEKNFKMQSVKSNTAPIHVDADFINENLGTEKFCNNKDISNSRAEKADNAYMNVINEQQVLHQSSEAKCGYSSESTLSESTMSADEVSDRDSQATFDTSLQSSSNSESDIKWETSSSAMSVDSLSEPNDENRNETGATSNLRASP